MGVGALRLSCRLLLFALLLLLIRVVVVGFSLLGCCFSLFTTQHNTADSSGPALVYFTIIFAIPLISSS